MFQHRFSMDEIVCSSRFPRDREICGMFSWVNFQEAALFSARNNSFGFALTTPSGGLNLLPGSSTSRLLSTIRV